MGSSQTGAWTRVPCIGRQILNHCATREAPQFLLSYDFKCSKGNGNSHYMAILARFWVGLIAPMRCRYYHSHFICGKTKVQRSSGTWSRSCRGEMLYQDLNVHLSDHKAIQLWSQSLAPPKKSLSILSPVQTVICFKLISTCTFHLSVIQSPFSWPWPQGWSE